jgi:hypothetical protein
VTALIVALVAAAVLGAWVWSARFCYRYMTRHELLHLKAGACSHGYHVIHRDESCCPYDEERSDSARLAWSLVPGLVLWFGLTALVTCRQPVSASALRAQLAEAERALAEATEAQRRAQAGPPETAARRFLRSLR